jgi:membrane protease subunit (stomatin/prohibitin family)
MLFYCSVQQPKGKKMSTSDRVCPNCGDIGATPQMNFCSGCGKPLEMKGILRSAAESIPGAAAVGLGVGLGLHAADTLVDDIANAASDLFN